jgi:hypothetical protein
VLGTGALAFAIQLAAILRFDPSRATTLSRIRLVLFGVLTGVSALRAAMIWTGHAADLGLVGASTVGYALVAVIVIVGLECIRLMEVRHRGPN